MMERYDTFSFYRIQMHGNDDDARICEAFADLLSRRPVETHCAMRGMMSPERCRILISHGFFDIVPEVNRTREICLEAVKQEGSLLSQVPKKHRDDEMCRTALENCDDLLGLWDLVPESVRKGAETPKEFLDMRPKKD